MESFEALYRQHVQSEYPDPRSVDAMKSPRDGWDADEKRVLALLGEEIDDLARRHVNDPPLEVLRAGYHDALPPDLQSDVTGYLSNNAWIRALIVGIELPDEDRLLAHIRKQANQPGPRTARWRWLAPALAGATLAVAMLAVWMFRPGAGPSATGPVEPPREMAAAPRGPEVRLPLEQPEVMLSTAALTWRGSARGNQLPVDLKPAVDAFRKGDYAGADREFTALEERYPGAVEVFYYGGVSRLYLDDPQRAIARLQKARELADATFAPDIDWYRAIAEQRAGHPAEMRARLDALCLGTSARAARACGALKHLGPPDGR
jgi:hypothetical protein